jgi:hypothetical protein
MGNVAVANSAFVQGTNSGTLIVRNGGEGHVLSNEAEELLRIYETLSVRRRMELLNKAFALDEEESRNPKGEL